MLGQDCLPAACGREDLRISVPLRAETAGGECELQQTLTAPATFAASACVPSNWTADVRLERDRAWGEHSQCVTPPLNQSRHLVTRRSASAKRPLGWSSFVPLLGANATTVVISTSTVSRTAAGEPTFKEVWRGDGLISGVDGVTAAQVSGDSVALSVGSGEYSFRLRERTEVVAMMR